MLYHVYISHEMRHIHQVLVLAMPRMRTVNWAGHGSGLASLLEQVSAHAHGLLFRGA